MSTKEILTAIVIHLLVPLIGILLFVKIRSNMYKKAVRDAPLMELLILFISYGGLLLLSLTSMYWKWSGMASLGTIYLIIVSPIAMAFVFYRQYKLRKISIYHYGVLIFSVAYYLIAPLVLYLLIKNSPN